MGIKELFIIRHGETTFNIEGRVQGQIDKKAFLSEKGLTQAEQLGQRFYVSKIDYDKIYSSDLRRARQTAGSILKYLGVPLEFNSNLRERGFGDLEGKTIYELGIENCREEDLYNLNQEGIMSSSESLKSVKTRASNVLKKAINSPEKRIILVGHEWINSYIINNLLNEGPIFHGQENAGVQYFKLNDGRLIDYKLQPRR